MFGVAKELEKQAFRVGDDDARFAHLAHGVFLVGEVARGDAVGGEVDASAIMLQFEGGLQDADVGFGANDDDMARTTCLYGGIDVGYAGREAGFFENGGMFCEFADFWQGVAESFGVLLADESGNAECLQASKQHAGLRNHVCAAMKDGHEALLDVNDEAEGVVRAGEEGHGRFSLVGVRKIIFLKRFD